MISVNPKVLHRFQVMVCEEIFAKCGFGPFGVSKSETLVDPEGENIRTSKRL